MPNFRHCCLDELHIRRQLLRLLLVHARMLARVIADLEALIVQRLDLLPGHVVRLVHEELKALRDEERGPKAMLLQQRCHKRRLTRHRVIKREHHELVRHRFSGMQCPAEHQSQAGEGKGGEKSFHGG
jgi:hypothetical protein